MRGGDEGRRGFRSLADRKGAEVLARSSRENTHTHTHSHLAIYSESECLSTYRSSSAKNQMDKKNVPLAPNVQLYIYKHERNFTGARAGRPSWIPP